MKRFLVIPLLSLGVTAMAQTIGEGEALDTALGFLASQRQAQSQQAGAPQLTLAHKSAVGNETYYYVFNQADGGFVIVGGDQAALPILGYSTSGSFDYAQLPPAMRWWLEQYDQQISHAIRQVRQGEALPQRAPRRAARADVAPLLGTGADAIQWNQSSPYNLAIDGGTGDYLTGCTSTAGAQVMRYHQWPDTDTGIRFEQMELGQNKAGNATAYAPAITEDYTYNWSSMQPQYASGTYQLNDANVKDVANLMYRLGRSIEAKYGISGTGAAIYKMGQKLIENFKYDKGLLYRSRSYYSDAEWEQMVFDELAAQRPVIYGGQDAHGGGGHAFVCDGYQQSSNLYHINWGWAGHYDNYFALTGTGALKPNGNGAGGAGDNAEYTVTQEILTGFTPDRTSTSEYPYSVSAKAYTLESDEVEYGKEVVLNGGFFNTGYTDIPYIYVGAIFEDTSDNTQVYVSTYQSSRLSPNYGFNRMSVQLPTQLIEGNTYRVYPAYKIGEGEWQYMHYPADMTVPVMTVLTADRSIKVSCNPFELGNNEVALGGKTTASGSFSNSGNFTATITFGFKFTNTQNPTDVAYSESWTQEQLQKGYGFNTLDVNVPVSLTIGQTYTVTSVFRNSQGEWQESTKRSEFDDPTLTVIAPTQLIFAAKPVVANGGYFTSNPEMTFTLANYTGSTVSTQIWIYIFPIGGGSSVDMIIPKNIILEEGETQTITVESSDWWLNKCSSNNDYFFMVYDNDDYPVENLRTYIYCREACPVTFELTPAQWGTLCLPYEAEVPAGLTAYSVTGEVDGKLIREEASKLEMQKPYLITGTPGTYNFSGPQTPEGNFTNGLLTGVTTTPAAGTELTAPLGSYVLQNGVDGVAFYHVEATQKIRQYSAYLQLPGGSHARSLQMGDELGISDVLAEPAQTHAPAYRIDGRRAASDSKGLMIQNGKLNFIK